MTGRPLPDVENPLFADVWAGAARGELVLPRCAACRTWAWPHRETCVGCGGEEFEPGVLPPRGRLYSWTQVARQTVRGIPAPYTVVLVDLDGAPGVRMLGTLVGDAAELRDGLPLHAVFTPVDGVHLIEWTAELTDTEERS